MDWINAFLALLAVSNVGPILPLVLRVSGSFPPASRRRVLSLSLAAGNSVALAFVLGGGALLAFMGVLVDDVRIAGGLVLLIFALYDLLFSREQRQEAIGEVVEDATQVPFVPLGIPLLVGPATLATTLVITEVFGVGPAVFAIAANASLNWLILMFGERIHAMLGRGVMRALGKVMGLVLAALAVSMIRSGIAGAIAAA